MSIDGMRFGGRRRRAARRIAFVLAALVPATGCVTWRTQLAGPRAVVEQRPEAVRVSGGLGDVTVVGPYLAGDTIIGRLDSRSGVETRVPLDQVVTIETREPSLKPLAYAAVAVVGLTLVAYLALLVHLHQHQGST